ncbi:MAG: MarR family winged helix-turn-helix transcriptional regulator [Solirubrobacterales bacterium]
MRQSRKHTDDNDAAGFQLFRPADLTSLLHAATERMAIGFDRAAAEIGLTDVRDWLVLAALDDGEQRTQAQLGQIVCVDKTTLIAVLDRLEERKLIARTVSSSDRRVRIPRITAAGRRMFAKFATVRDEIEGRALEGVGSEERQLLLTLLARIADRETTEIQDAIVGAATSG